MLKQKKAVLFDLDGTLLDSMWVWVSIDEKYSKKYQFTYDKEVVHREIEGMSFYETAVYFKEKFLLLQPVEEIMREWNEMALEAYRTEVPLKRGAAKLLRFLDQAGYRTAICTSNSRELVDAVTSHWPELKTIDYIVTADEVSAGKPAPDVYLRAAARLGVLPEECLVFEDVPQGILAGKRAGMEVCAVEDAFSFALTEEKRTLADYYITDFEQLEMMLDEKRSARP